MKDCIYKNVCRICLNKRERVVSLFKDVQVKKDCLLSYSRMLEECASVNISDSEILSTIVCINCTKKLEANYKFRLQCISSHNILKEYVEKNILKTEIKLEENIMDLNLIYKNNEENMLNIRENVKYEQNFDEQFLDSMKSDNESNNKVHDDTGIENKCDNYEETFDDEINFTKHKKLERKQNNHVCHICNKKYRANWGLKKHILTHGFNCKVCFQTFDNAQELDDHTKTHLTDTGYVCNECGNIFKKIRHLRAHVMRSHSNVIREKRFLCTYCGKAFAEPGNLKTHLRIHTGEKPYSCKICGASFIQWYSLHSHSITHSKEKKHICKMCNKLFARKSGLRRHILTHTNERKFPCEICDKRFKDKSELKEHMLRHTGQRNYTCSECNKSFYRRYHLTIHMRSHSGEKPYPCSECGKSFAQKHVLNSHLKTIHSK